MADAVRIALDAPAAAKDRHVFNVSDLFLDRHDLLSRYAAMHGITNAPPPRAPCPAPNEMVCARLRALGWRTGGADRLEEFLRSFRPGDPDRA